MFLFISNSIDHDKVVLTGDEATHAIRVVRLGIGDEFLVTMLDGTMHKARVSSISRDVLEGEVVESYSDWEKREYMLRICISPTKNIDRFEWFLEKATEIGVDRITPIITSHSERRIIKSERLEKVICSAVKQSMKATMPILDPLTDVKLLFSEKQDPNSQLYIAHCENDNEKIAITHDIKPNRQYTILIGPEGDFSEEEIQMAKQNGFIPVSLGTSRLRTETAGVWVAALAHITNIAK